MDHEEKDYLPFLLVQGSDPQKAIIALYKSESSINPLTSEAYTLSEAYGNILITKQSFEKYCTENNDYFILGNSFNNLSSYVFQIPLYLRV